MNVVAGLDLASRKTGWCVGTGQTVPTAGAWLWPQVEDDYGQMGAFLRADLTELKRLYGVTHLIYEAPMMNPQRDRLNTLRKLLSLGPFTELFCRDLGIVCEEADIKRIKRELGGRSGADKLDMIHVAEKVGVILPQTTAAGREDAADAVGAWLVGVRYHAKAFSADWDRRLYSSRGGLL